MFLHPADAADRARYKREKTERALKELRDSERRCVRVDLVCRNLTFLRANSESTHSHLMGFFHFFFMKRQRELRFGDLFCSNK